MSIQITTLDNGLIVATDQMSNLLSAALGVWVNCGSRHELKREAGLSHLLEHMAFKGTSSRTAKDIATEIEAVGGDLNAYTGREQTAYHARVLREDVPLALNIISDILIRPMFAEGELIREREVIVQEIGQTRDTPDDVIFDLLQTACYPDQPLGWPIYGSEQTVLKFSKMDLEAYMAANYRAGDMMLVASGAVEHGAIVDAASQLFAPLAKGTARAAPAAQYSPNEVREETDLEQAHLAFAFPGLASGDDEIIVARVFATALGGGMSSRLFQEAREKRGLCYAIYAFSASYSDTGILGVYAGTAEDKAGEIAPIIAGEMEALAISATEEETARARAQLKATLFMALESPSSRTERIASNLPVYGRVLSVPELLERLEAVDAAALRRFASKVCEHGQPALAAIGPVKRLETRGIFASRFGRVATAIDIS